MALVPNRAFKYRLVVQLGRFREGIPFEILVSKRQTLIILETHRIDTVVFWSYLVGPQGTVVRSLHEKNRTPLYPEVYKCLERYGFRVVLSKKLAGIAGKDAFAYRS